jgi:hypothetical protein
MKNRTVKLQDILTPDQFKAVCQIVKQNKDMTDRIRELKAYFRTIEMDLARHVIVPDYLAYAVTNAAHTLGL